MARNVLSMLKEKMLGRTSRPVPPRRTPARFRPGLEPLDERLVPSITYNNGPVMYHPYVSAIYLGNAWKTDPSLMHERQQLDNFLTDIVNSPYMDALGEYYMNDPYRGKVSVGHGTYYGSKSVDYTFRTSNGYQVVDDNDIHTAITQQVDGGYISAGGPDSLVMVFTPSNVRLVSNGGGSNAWLNELGHHNSYVDPFNGTVPYAVIPNPTGNPNTYWAGTTTDIAKLTGSASHEFEEAVTDPILGTGWYDNSPPTKPGPYGHSQVGIDEIGDDVQYYEPNNNAFGPNQQYSILNGYVVQNVWSVKAGGPVTLPATPPDMVGAGFPITNNSWVPNVEVGLLVVSWENPTTGAFGGEYTDVLTNTVMWASGQITTHSGTLGALSGIYGITFHSTGTAVGYAGESVSFSGLLTGNGNGSASWGDEMWGTMTDNVVFGSFYTDVRD